MRVLEFDGDRLDPSFRYKLVYESSAGLDKTFTGTVTNPMSSSSDALCLAVARDASVQALQRWKSLDVHVAIRQGGSSRFCRWAQSHCVLRAVRDGSAVSVS